MLVKKPDGYITLRDWLKDYKFLPPDQTKFSDVDLEKRVIFVSDCWKTEGEIVVWLDLMDKPIYFKED